MIYRIIKLSAVLLTVGLAISSPRVNAQSDEGVKFFESRIRPILVRECYGCHSDAGGNVRGGLRLDTRERTLIGGNDGAAIVPGDPESSLLFLAITHEGYEMPPEKKLPDDVAEDFRQWILMGAPDPRVSAVSAVPVPLDDEVIAKAKRERWSLQPPRAVDPKTLLSASTTKRKSATATSLDWSWNKVDEFAIAKLQSVGLSPANDCEPSVLLRRLYFDLIGLPPIPAELKAFEKDCDTDRQAAIEKVVDRLLDSPEFGRRWGRHWLDVARYAESTGSTVNMTYPHAWRYRDYVIDSFNQDKPFDEFLREQIAGDLLPAKDDNEWSEHLIATTFLALGPKVVNENNATQFRADLIDEQIDTVTKVFLGQSVACARCHDHKLDPIAQTDYYAMAGIFGSTRTYFGSPPSPEARMDSVGLRQTSSLLLLPNEQTDPVAPKYTAEQISQMREEIRTLKSELGELGRRGDAQTAINDRLRLTRQISDLSAKLGVLDEAGNARAYTMGVQDETNPDDAPFLHRGEIDERGPKIPRGLPAALTCQTKKIDSSQSGRLEVAQDFSSPQHPLTARVYVNRVWAHVFGRGIVASVDDFGASGDTPSHPELLDTLAVEFMNEGWSTKKLIRQLITSRIYQTDSTFDAQAQAIDPDNQYLWRRSPKRLDAEAIRDSMLAVSELLETTRPAGSAVAKAGYTRVTGNVLGNPRERIESMAKERFGRSQTDDPMNATRDRFRFISTIQSELQDELNGTKDNSRSVFLPIIRDNAPRSLDVFDLADANRVLGQRETSHTADQALFFMNNPLVHRTSLAMANRVCAASLDTKERIETAFLLALSRNPSPREIAASRKFILELAPDRTVDPWLAFCQSLMASAEFRILD
jgi:Protein of unknown function (DUF1549)/Protein of unknown function (DUF1553)/Planctomycete cytochrome C